MVFVEVRLRSLDLSSHMADMRVWLDGNWVETAGFSYEEHFESARARLAFRKPVDAEAFAARFAGRIISNRAPARARPAKIAPTRLHGLAVVS